MGEGAARRSPGATSSSRTRAASRRACARQFLTPYGVEFVELPELQRIYIFDIGGPHTYRTIYMDGRTHPTNARRRATTATRSAGGRATRSSSTRSASTKASGWIATGSPHTEQLHTIERFTRTDFDTLRYELTVDDPGAYTTTWAGATNLRWEAGTELFEYVCQQANYAGSLMVGAHDKVDRGTVAVP